MSSQSTSKTRPKLLFGYKGHHSPSWRGVKIGAYVWGVYKVYSSKAAAETGLRGLKMGLGRREPRADLRVVKTVKGWAVVQRSPYEQYRVLANSPSLFLST